jgi:hypothetical protein
MNWQALPITIRYRPAASRILPGRSLVRCPRRLGRPLRSILGLGFVLPARTRCSLPNRSLPISPAIAFAASSAGRDAHASMEGCFRLS